MGAGDHFRLEDLVQRHGPQHFAAETYSTRQTYTLENDVW